MPQQHFGNKVHFCTWKNIGSSLQAMIQVFEVSLTSVQCSAPFAVL